MTPKEKAEELVQKYVMSIPTPYHIHDAKICALIAVNLLLDEMFFEDEPIYWTQVKEEIENL